jgi:hypothetical protein
MTGRRAFLIVNPYQPQLLRRHPRPTRGPAATVEALDRLEALDARLARLEARLPRPGGRNDRILLVLDGVGSPASSPPTYGHERTLTCNRA